MHALFYSRAAATFMSARFAMAHSEVGHYKSDSQALNDEQHSPTDTKSSLEKIKKQLSAGSGNVLLQGPLLKRSETLRKWNQRWFTLDPATGKMDYRMERGDLSARGQIFFDADTTITMSPINFHGARKYDGCCFYIGTPHKKEYYLCAESPVVARSWVATLRAAALVLKAHKEAVNSLSGNGAAKLGTVAAVVAAANSVAKEAARDIAEEMQTSIKTALSGKSSQVTDGVMDNLSIMKETLRVKDEELHQLSKELRARDITIKELADRLSDTADAAEAAAAAAHAMDKERKAAKAEADHARKEMDERKKVAEMLVRAGDQRYAATVKEKDEALQEAHRWQKELAKAREQMLLMQASFQQAEQSARKAVADVEEKLKAREAELAALASKEKLVREELSQGKASRPTGASELEGDTVTGTSEVLLHEASVEPQQRDVSLDTGDGNVVHATDSERASNPDEEQEEAVKSEVLQPSFVEAVPNEREVLVDTCSPEVDASRRSPAAEP